MSGEMFDPPAITQACVSTGWGTGEGLWVAIAVALANPGVAGTAHSKAVCPHGLCGQQNLSLSLRYVDFRTGLFGSHC